MTLALLRTRFAAVAFKVEATPGTDAIAGSPVAGDFFGTDCEVDFNPTVVANPELTGSLDDGAGIVGGLRPSLRLRVPLRGSGAPGTAPEWGKILRCGTMVETVTGSVVGVPTAVAASGSSVSSVALATPFGTTAQQYRGMPLILSGVVVDTTAITDYTAARVATVASTLSGIPVATTSAQIPINVLYGPTSDETVYKTATIYIYRDGGLWIFTGCVGSPSFELTTGGIGFISMDLRGQFVSYTNVALPAIAAAAIKQTPPRWVAGRCQLNRAVARTRSLSLSLGVSTVLPDNPEATEGYDPAVPIMRDAGGSVNPLIDTTTQVALMAAFRAGTPMTIMAIIGSVAGNRFLVTVPNARATNMKPGDREGLGQNEVPFQCDGADAPFFICSY